MKKMIITAIIGIVVMALLYATAASIFISGLSDISDKADVYELNIGKTIVIDKDTLTIVNYSLINESYALSNGTNVNVKLVENKLNERY